MAKSLVQAIQNQINAAEIKTQVIFKIEGVDKTSYLLSYTISADRTFGSNSGIFVLDNTDGIFGEGGTNKINVGDLVELSEYYYGTTDEWKQFYGRVEQRTIGKEDNSRIITLNCLDYIATLQKWDIDLVCEGDKMEVRNETLTPNYLSEPNEEFAQLFNFANDAIATDPAPIFTFKDKNNLTEDPQYDGFEVYYGVGQVKLGSPLNALYNYDFVAKSYYYYRHGIYIEDILEDLLITADGYGNFLFNEPTAQMVINNHLIENFYNVEETITDVMTPNYTSSTITIETTTIQEINTGNTIVHVLSTDGFPDPESGSTAECSINGDIFTYTNKTSDTLEGIPSSGSYALKNHAIGAYVEYEHTYTIGQVWYLKYSNVTSDLTINDFSFISGIEISHFDKRNGRILLDRSIPISSYVTCNTNYSFKTLQTAGIQLNKIIFRSREIENRFEAINKLRKYLPPNYIVRTQGDKKIWASLLSQKVTADYTLSLVTKLDYMEDEDLYTRVLFYGKNKNPSNIMFKDGIDFVTTGESYKASASQNALVYNADESSEGWLMYESAISDAGYITIEDRIPIVYINGIPIDNKSHQMVGMPLVTELTTTTVTTTQSDKKGDIDTQTRTYYYYKLYFPHMSIEPSQIIHIYDINGIEQITVAANDNNMDYARGIYNVPGSSQNSMVETLSTATYTVFYATHNLEIDYDNVKFKIKNTILPDPTKAKITATYDYWTSFTSARGAGAIIDGRWDTQCQTEFFAEPPSGYNYAIIDLGATYIIQAMDMVAGFYKPDEYRKFDIDFRFTMHYSLNGTDYYNITDALHNVRLTGGESVSFEEEDLGIGFSARYLKIILENVKKVDYGDGVYVVAITEFSIYGDIILKSEATLIPSTTLISPVYSGDTVIHVTSTEGFTDPGSGNPETTAYIGSTAFTYTSLGSGNTTFQGCSMTSGVAEGIGTRVSQSIESSTNTYDDNLLSNLGDRLYKEIRISDDYLYTQTELDNLAKKYLEEFIKNHTKIGVNILFAPYLKIGQTVSLTDSYQNISNVNYFIESINNRNGYLDLIIARYP